MSTRDTHPHAWIYKVTENDRGELKPLPKIKTIYQLERRYIVRAWFTCGYNKMRTAKELGISIRCLRNKLIEYEQQGYPLPRPARDWKMRNGVALERYEHGDDSEDETCLR